MTETDGMSARFMTTIVGLIIVRIVSLFWHYLWKKKKRNFWFGLEKWILKFISLIS